MSWTEERSGKERAWERRGVGEGEMVETGGAGLERHALSGRYRRAFLLLNSSDRVWFLLVLDSARLRPGCWISMAHAGRWRLPSAFRALVSAFCSAGSLPTPMVWSAALTCLFSSSTELSRWSQLCAALPSGDGAASLTTMFLIDEMMHFQT